MVPSIVLQAAKKFLADKINPLAVSVDSPLDFLLSRFKPSAHHQEIERYMVAIADLVLVEIGRAHV